MPDIVSLDLTSWSPHQSADVQQTAIRTLESGGVLVLPRLAFALCETETRFLSPQWSDHRAKNISLEGSSLKGAQGAAQDLAALAAMIARFAASAAELVSGLFPRYAPYVKAARTSFRPNPPSAGRCHGARTMHCCTSMPFRLARIAANGSCVFSAT